MNEISIIILAAGNGTRMKSQKSKVLHTLCGQAMINHILNKTKLITDDVKVVLSYQFDDVKNAILKDFKDVQIIRQDSENFPGTAGAVMACLEYLTSKKTIIICGDMPLIEEKDLKSLYQNKIDITILAFKAKNPYGYGRVITNKNNVVKIVEEKDATQNETLVDLCNSGAYCFDTDLLKSLVPLIKNNNSNKEFYLTDIIELAIKDKKNVGYKVGFEENFMGINDKLSLSIAECIMQKKIKENLMKNGIIMSLPDTIFIDSRAKFEGECIIESNVIIIGDSFIKDSHIKTGCVIEFSDVVNSDIGPMAHLRPSSKVRNTHIGNFVELKNATLTQVKAGHLSYLGDCTIGEGTNVGCGTITCNYDGKKKHKTIIGKNVFIGSDTQLIAPLHIADDTIIAAGSTVTNSSEKGDLIISRQKQVNKAKYFYKFFGQDDEK